MAGSNWAIGGIFYEQASDDEIESRIAIIRAAKRAAGSRELTDDELDRLLAPVPCLRTRRRLAAATAGKSYSAKRDR